jgi:hypothetical protein
MACEECHKGCGAAVYVSMAGRRVYHKGVRAAAYVSMAGFKEVQMGNGFVSMAGRRIPGGYGGSGMLRHGGKTRFKDRTAADTA